MNQHLTSSRPRWWQWLTVLSLDAPLVALLWQWMFAWGLGIRLPWQDPLLLGLGVWVSYAADRWIEGWRLTPEIVQTPRHLFYMRHRWPVFGVAMGVVAAIVMVALTRLDRRELEAGVILLIPTSLYLFSHQFLHRHHPLRLPKEICIAVIFAFGCALAPAVHASGRLTLLYVPAVLFGLLCFTNCALISVWEMEVDTRHGQTSLALQLKGAAVLIHLLPWFIAIIGAVIAADGPAAIRSAAVCSAASGVLMGVLNGAQSRVGRVRARATVDLALMTPALALLVFAFC